VLRGLFEYTNIIINDTGDGEEFEIIINKEIPLKQIEDCIINAKIESKIHESKTSNV
jgi:hypothetical protein